MAVERTPSAARERLAEGRRPPCACFGALSRRPVGPGSVVRNVVLIALALLAAFA